MSFRILILCLAVGVCALWPQGLVLCVGEAGHAEVEPGCTPCCPADRPDVPDEDGQDDDCRDFESPELTAVTPAPALPAPTVRTATDLLAPDAAPAPSPADDGRPPHDRIDDLDTVILVV